MAQILETVIAVNALLSGGFKQTFSQAQAAMQGLQGKSKELNKALSQVSSYKSQQQALTQTSERLSQAKERVNELSRQMNSSTTPSKQLQREFAQASREAEKLQLEFNKQQNALNSLGVSLAQAGINTNDLAGAQRNLESQSERVTRSQERLSRAQARYNKTRDALRWDNIKGSLVTSAATIGTLAAPTMAASEFELASARLNAVAFSGGGRDKEQDARDFARLQEQAKALGAATQFTAVQAAQSQEALARAGFNTNEIIASMPGLLDMAAAEGMDLATAADIMASSLRGFGLEAVNAGRVSNILAQTSAASNSSIVGLGESLKYVAPLAAGLGISIEEVNAMLGKMADAGIKGSQGGTALRAALTRLSKEPATVAKELDKLGISSRDAQGNLRDLPELFNAINAKIASYGSADKLQVLSRIFGDEAGSGMLAVMNASVDGTLQSLTRLNRESSGEFKALVDNTNLSLELLRDSITNTDPIARKLGISFRDLSVYVAMLNSESLKGVDADNALAEAFGRISSSPKKAADALRQFNVALTDKDGYVRDFKAILIDLNNALSDFTPDEQLAKLVPAFGEQGAKAVSALMTGMKSGLHDSMSSIVDQAVGTSGEMASKIMNTLWGQTESAKSAIQGLMIDIGEAILPAAKQWVISFTSMTQAIGKFAKEHPAVLEGLVKLIAAIGALNVAKTTGSILWNAIRLPYDAIKLYREAAGAIELIGGHLGKLPALINILTSPTALWTAGIVAAGVAAYEVYKHWDEIKAFFANWVMPNIFEPLYEWAMNAIDSVKGLWQDFCDWLASLNPFKSWSTPAPESVNIGGVTHATNSSRQAANALNALGGYQPPELHALGGIFARPHIGVVAEAGREAIIPLENNRDRGVSLWTKAGEMLGMFDSDSESNAPSPIGLSTPGNVINNAGNNTNASTIAPVFNITFAREPEDREGFMSLFRSAWSEFQEQELRVSFA